MNLLVEGVHDQVQPMVAGELRMLPTLVRALRSRRWVNADTLVVQEFPLNGRRVDLVTLTRSGVLASFELKLGGFGRVLEQAAYNRLSFDRSWVVVDRRPLTVNLDQAVEHGIGVMVVTGLEISIACRPGQADYEPAMRNRIAHRIRLEHQIV